MHRSIFVATTALFLIQLLRPSDEALAVRLTGDARVDASTGFGTIRYAIRNNGHQSYYVYGQNDRARIVMERRLGGAWLVHARMPLRCHEMSRRLLNDGLDHVSRCTGELRVHTPGTYRLRIVMVESRRRAWHTVTSEPFSVLPAPVPADR